MRRVRLWILLAVSVTAFAAVADPFVGFAYPAGVQAGKTVRVIVGGQGFGGVEHGWVSGEGVKIVGIERMPGFTRAPGDGQRPWLEKWIRNVEDGVKAMPPLPKDEILRNWPRNRWWETLDKLDALAFSLVARDHFSPRPDPLQAAPAIAERLILTVVADRTAEPGLRSVVLYNGNGASAPHPFFVTSEPHMAEPLYAAPPPKGRKREKPEPAPCQTPVVLDGQVLPGETDVFRLALNGGDRLLCLLTGRELVPYLGDAVPGFFNPVLRLTDEEGRELAFADDYYYLPDPVLSCKIPKTGIYRLEVRDNLYRGRDDFVYSISCFTDGRPLPTPQERAFICRPAPAVRSVCTGNVESSGGKFSFDFKVSQPGERVFDLFARRGGSPLDGVMWLYGPMKGLLWKDGPLLATWDDVTNVLYVGSIPQAECDPSGTWNFTEPGDYRLVIGDRTGKGGDEYGFSLDIAPREPDFEVYALKSTLVLKPWKDAKTSFRVKVVRRNGFDGAITVLGNDDLAVVKGVIESGKNEAEIVVRTSKAEGDGVKRVRLTAVAAAGDDVVLKRPVVPGNESEQAFAYTHILPASDFLVIRQAAETGPAEPPSWIDMPYDGFLPRRVIHVASDLSSFKSDYVVGMEALSTADVSVVKVPADAGDAVLAAKFASSAAIVRKRNQGTFAVEPKGSVGDAAAARALLAGCRGMVTPKLDYAEGDERRIRTFAWAMALPPDNDILLYVPLEKGNPLPGSVGAAARRLRDGGWCFDYASDKTMAAALRTHVYRTVYVPKTRNPMSAETKALLDEAAKKQGLNVVAEGLQAKEEGKRLSKSARREEVPKGLLFARFGRKGGEGWYFVHNPTAARVAGDVRFNIRGKVQSAFLMDVRTGEVKSLPKTRDGKFTLTLDAGSSAWIRCLNRPANKNP